MNSNISTPRIKKRTIRIINLIIILIIESPLFLAWLALLPKDSGGGALFGFSYKRLLLMTIIILGGLGMSLLAMLLKRKPLWQDWLDNEDNFNKFLKRFIPTSFLLALAAWCFAFLYPFLNLPIISNDTYIRLLPVIFWIGSIAFQGFIILPLLFLNKNATHHKINIWKENSFLIILVSLLIIFALITLTKVGFHPQYFAINDLAVPVLEGQIWFVIGIIFLVFWLKIVLKQISGEERIADWLKRYEWLLLISLWAFAVIIWMSQPLPQFNYFAPRVVPPNYETYPFSDAEQYDYNSYMLIYGSTIGNIISKPLYVSFLAVLHLVGGNDYATIVMLQTLILAFIPVVIYLIGREIDSRIAGIAAALLFTLRELTSIQAVDFANVSNSKLLLSEMPTTLLICIFTLLLIKILKKHQLDWKYVLILGGLLGLIMLIRIQIMVLIPVIILIGLWHYSRRWKEFSLFILCFIGGTIIVILPILTRNFFMNGSFWFEKPVYLEGFQSLYSSSSSFFANIWLNIQLTADNFARDLISTLLIFPTRLGQVNNFGNLLHVSQAFWADVPASFSLIDILINILNLILLAYGMSIVWRKNCLVLISLFLIFVAYVLSSAFVRMSGWRFLLPIDWLVLVFYSIGVVAILRVIMSCIWGKENKHEPENNKTSEKTELTTPTLVFWLASFILISSIIPLRELLIPPLIKEEPKEQLCRTVSNSEAFLSSGINMDKFMADCSANDAVVLKGLAFYPRFIESGYAFRNVPGDLYNGPQNFSRLLFRFLNQNGAGNVITILDQSPDFFPNGSNVILIGHFGQVNIAEYVLVSNKNESKLLISNPQNVSLNN